MILKWAVKILTNAIRKDPDLWMAYQSNIAVCFMDEIRRDGPKMPGDTLHNIANRAAYNFLKIWTRK